MKSKNNRKVAAVILLTLFFAAGVSGVFYFSGSHHQNSATGTSKVSCLKSTGSAIDGLPKAPSSKDVMEKLRKQQVNVTDKLSSCISFTNGKQGAEGHWIVENLPTNNVIMQCEVYLNNSSIAKSDSIYPNQHIEHITLLQSVKPGIYDVMAYVNYYDLNTKQYISKAGYVIKMNVE